MQKKIIDFNKHYDLDKQLLKACDKIDIKKVKKLLAAGADVDFKNKKGRTPLHYAVANGNLELIKLLIAAGADVHAKTCYGETLLHYAAAYDHVDCIIFLLEKGADKNAEDDALQTPFNYLSETTRTKLINRIEDRIEQLLQMQRGKND